MSSEVVMIQCPRCEKINNRNRTFCINCRAQLQDPTLTDADPQPNRSPDFY